MFSSSSRPHIALIASGSLSTLLIVFQTKEPRSCPAIWPALWSTICDVRRRHDLYTDKLLLAEIESGRLIPMLGIDGREL